MTQLSQLEPCYRQAKPSSSTSMQKYPEHKAPIHIRLKAIITAETDEAGRFPWLQKHTGISRNTWNTWWKKENSVPSGELIEAAAKLWPKYAFWLATGVTDRRNGHTYPKTLTAVDSWPEFESIKLKRANDYFLHCIQMQDRQFNEKTYYRSERRWDEDWAMLNFTAWSREVERESFEAQTCAARIETKSANDYYERSWWPDSSIDEDSAQ